MNNENTQRFNILSKVDKAFAPIPNRKKTVSKVEKFAWSTSGVKGEFRWINKNDLNIDGRYQRDKVSDKKVLDIARDWDWLLVGVLSVIQREDGSLWVFDGGHRTRASFSRHDVTELPCMVHQVSSLTDEAKAFVARNTMVSNVSAVDRFKASCFAGEPIAKNVQAILEEFELEVVKGGNLKERQISCIGSLQHCVEIDFEGTRKVLGFLLDMNPEKNVTNKVLKGMFTLWNHFKPQFDVIDKYGEKISLHSHRAIEIKINEFVAECNKSGEVIFAKAILQIINYKLKTKRLEW
jgi:hypothetical protein